MLSGLTEHSGSIQGVSQHASVVQCHFNNVNLVLLVVCFISQLRNGLGHHIWKLDLQNRCKIVVTYLDSAAYYFLVYVWYNLVYFVNYKS